MKPEVLGKKSVWRNKLMADLFYRIGEVKKRKKEKKKGVRV